MNKRNVLIAALLLISFWTLFYNLGKPNFYHLRNESRRAQISQEMIETGNWLIPHLEEETILTKPPLFYWSVAVCSLKTGVTELTARIPSAVAGFGTVIFTLLIGTLLFNLQTGFLSAFALLAMNLFMHQARYAELESMLSFFVSASIYFFLKGYKEPSRRTLWFALFFAMMGLGMMTKGPFALTFPFIPIIGFLLITREIGLLRSKPFLLGSLWFFIIVLPWPLFIMKDNPDFIKLVLWETAVRAATGFVHREPFQFYFLEIIRVLFPWIFMLPFAVWLACSRRLQKSRQENFFVLFWFLGNLLFLSLLKSKRDYYLFPIAPAVALLAGMTWEPFWQWLREKMPVQKAACLRAVFFGGFACAGASFFAGNPFAVNIPEMHSLDIAPLLLFSGVCLMAVSSAKMCMPRAALDKIAFMTVMALMLLVHFAYFTFTVPLRNMQDSGKDFYRDVARIVPKNERLGFAWKNENYTFIFYARRPMTTIKDEKDIAGFMASPEKTWLVMRGHRFKKLSPLPWRMAARTPYAEHDSWKGYVLLCNK
ncbi:MAG: glycosyltransferase family 39 protein [Deltaproteobacteria bacterium]|nr:glycosyltransferase family 39 protein [Deltaproteobacteria bacterium]